MAHGSVENIRLGNREEASITLLDPEMALDVGAVAKGYVAQAAAEAARLAGGENFAISAGGNVVVWGDVNGRPWNVGIRDPQSNDPAAYATTVEASYTSLVTSGGYEHNLVVDGKEYCHIIDPQNRLSRQLCTVCHGHPFYSDEADIYSTALFLMTPEEAMAFAEANGFRAIIIDREGKIWDSDSNK